MQMTAEPPAPPPEPPERTEGLTVSNPIRDGADAYEIVQSAASGLWIITAIVGFCGHFRWRSRREAKQQEGRRSSVGPVSFGPDSADGGLQLGELGVL